MAFLDVFNDVKTISAVVKRTSGVFSTTTGKVTSTQSTTGTLLCIFYLGGQSEFSVADKIRENVDATMIVSSGSNIRERDTVTINSKDYSVIFVDDVALQSEATVVLLSKIA
jgi:hypothetical protein